jgi:hypothetical protein
MAICLLNKLASMTVYSTVLPTINHLLQFPHSILHEHILSQVRLLRIEFLTFELLALLANH